MNPNTSCELKEKLPLVHHRAIAAAVRRGAKMLDKHAPGWHRRVKTTELRMDDGCNCIYGQLDKTELFWEIEKGNIKVGYVIPDSVTPWCEKDTTDGGRYSGIRQALAWDALQEEWLRAIAERRNTSRFRISLPHIKTFTDRFGREAAYK